MKPLKDAESAGIFVSLCLFKMETKCSKLPHSAPLPLASLADALAPIPLPFQFCLKWGQDVTWQAILETEFRVLIVPVQLCAHCSELDSGTPHLGSPEAAGLRILAFCLMTFKFVANGVLLVPLGAKGCPPPYCLCSGLCWLQLGSVPFSGKNSPTSRKSSEFYKSQFLIFLWG